MILIACPYFLEFGWGAQGRGVVSSGSWGFKGLKVSYVYLVVCYGPSVNKGCQKWPVKQLCQGFYARLPDWIVVQIVFPVQLHLMQKLRFEGCFASKQQSFRAICLLYLWWAWFFFRLESGLCISWALRFKTLCIVSLGTFLNHSLCVCVNLVIFFSPLSLIYYFLYFKRCTLGPLNFNVIFPELCWCALCCD